MEMFDSSGGSGGSSEVAPEMLVGFVQELEEIIGTLEQKLIELESDPTNAELISGIFRAFHNLKGSSGVMGFQILPEMMHYAESVLDLVRSGKKALSEELVSTLLDTLGALREVAATIKANGKEGKKRYFSLLARLEEFTNAAADVVAAADGAKQETKKADVAKKDDGASEDDDFIKVSRSLVDQMMLVTGDFMMVENGFQWIKKRRYADDWEFAENCNQLGHFSNKLQRIVLRMRLSPIKPVFTSMHRLVRTTASELKKKANFEVSGAETLLDRSILDVIADPLIHMLRNSLDHGLEGPEDRVKAGKPPEGQLNLAAFYKSGEVVIQISDDGRGIDPNLIKAKAVKTGLISEEEAAEISDAEAQRLIFAPGFSGADVVTTTSGRGVGMDVVKSTVESLAGAVDIVSTVGLGTTISLRLPLSLAISECLEFKVGTESYAVQQVNVEEVFSRESPLIRDNIKTLNDNSKILVLRDTPMPIVSLADAFRKVGVSDGEFIIQVKQGGTRFAMEVSAIVGPCNIVSQALPGAFSAEAPFSGVTKRGDGTLMFQLDLVRLASRLQIRSEDKSGRGNKVTASSQLTSSDVRRVQQKIAIFRTLENFCVPVQAIRRIVQVNASDIREIDGRFFMTLDGVTLPIIWAETSLLNRPRIIQDNYSVIVFHVDEKLFGLPVGTLRGIVRMPTAYENTMRTDAVLGTTVVDGESYTVLDLTGLAARVYKNEVVAIRPEAQAIRKVVIAEDDPFFRENLIAFLKARNIEPLVACDGLEAKNIMSNPQLMEGVGAVVTDIEMPRMDGISLIRWIKSTDSVRHLPCIVLTAITTKEMLKVAMSAGAVAFVAKMHHQEVLQEIKRIESGLDTDVRLAKQVVEEGKKSVPRVVTFTLRGSRFAFPMDVLKEVSYATPSLPVPSYPEWINQVTAFRGRMVPVIDLVSLFRIGAAESGIRTQQAIIESEGEIFAIRMETVEGVLPMSALVRGEAYPKMSERDAHMAQFMRGIYQYEGSLISLIDPRAMANLCNSADQRKTEEKAA